MDALAKYGRPDISTLIGSHFTGIAVSGMLQNAKGKVAMDGPGRRTRPGAAGHRP
ncbi:hypothetical protein [Rhodovulum sp. MB263]|uniref:hypothetical protein n=1 Tax=Rhodovulum sp. (strain MB263) TaxID=308754 RepID=UPI0018C8AD81|nr:hypothetical protein [Rhodovulum sp. MB263]